ncbi:MAG: hypothetical protein ABSA02_11880 [Trebonia sp.]|jgi:DNA topoisomerase IB
MVTFRPSGPTSPAADSTGTTIGGASGRTRRSSTGGKRHVQCVADGLASPVIRSLKHRRSWPDCDDLLVFRSGSRWHDVTAGNINDYLRDISGGDFTAKDFRTWHATVLAAVGLAVSQGAESTTARRRAITRVVKEFGDVATKGHAEQAVLRLLLAAPAKRGGV